MDVLQIDQASQAFPISSYVQVGRSPARCRHRTGRGCPRPGGGPGRGGVLSNQGGLAGVPASGCTDIEAGTVGAVIDQLDRFIHGEALGAVAGHRVGKLRIASFPLTCDTNEVSSHRRSGLHQGIARLPTGVHQHDPP